MCRDAMVSEAVDLMKTALALLDDAGMGGCDVACHLSLAVDVASGEPFDPKGASPLEGESFGPTGAFVVSSGI